jgi:hypothetical protein
MLRRTTATPGEAVKFGNGRSAKHPSPKKKAERRYPKYGTKRSQRNKEGLR